jgi:hypothetical protein
MNRPLIFEEYDYSKASTQFPLIEPSSTEKEVIDSAWIYTIDLMNSDPTILQEAFIGEYIGELDMMELYHRQVLQALSERNYEMIGIIVESAIGELNKQTVAYINEHQYELERRNV